MKWGRMQQRNQAHRAGVRLVRSLSAYLIISLASAALAQDQLEAALRHTYGTPTLLSHGYGSRWSVSARYTAAAFQSRHGPELVIVREEGGGLPIPTFRLSASLREDGMPLRDIQRLSRYVVDRLEFVTGPDGRSAWVIARLTCTCSHLVTYLAIQPIGLLNYSEVSVLILDSRQAPYQISELPETPSPHRSLLGLAATDGFVRSSGSPTVALPPVTFWQGNFVPDPTADCVVCAPTYRGRDPIAIYLIRYHGAVDVTSRIPETNHRRAGRFVVRVIYPYARLRDTLVLHEQNGRVSVLYQYSQTLLQEREWPEPLSGGYLWPDRLVDVNGDGYPELVGVEGCHCDVGYPYFAVMDLRNRDAVFVTYTGGPGIGPDEPETVVPYIRTLTNADSRHLQMQEELLSYLTRASVGRAREPADSKPLGRTNDIRVGRLETIP